MAIGFFCEPGSIFERCLVAEEVEMKNAKTYREYATDCIRMAKGMSNKDKEILLKMAQAWEDRAVEAERVEKLKGE
jgi:hypothetical protein